MKANLYLAAREMEVVQLPPKENSPLKGVYAKRHCEGAAPPVGIGDRQVRAPNMCDEHEWGSLTGQTPTPPRYAGWQSMALCSDLNMTLIYRQLTQIGTFKVWVNRAAVSLAELGLLTTGTHLYTGDNASSDSAKAARLQKASHWSPLLVVRQVVHVLLKASLWRMLTRLIAHLTFSVAAVTKCLRLVETTRLTCDCVFTGDLYMIRGLTAVVTDRQAAQTSAGRLPTLAQAAS